MTKAKNNPTKYWAVARKGSWWHIAVFKSKEKAERCVKHKEGYEVREVIA